MEVNFGKTIELAEQLGRVNVAVVPVPEDRSDEGVVLRLIGQDLMRKEPLVK